MLLAEVNQWPEDVKEYFGDGDECHMAFHFPLMPRMYMAIAREDRFPISDIIRQTPPIPETCQWAVFLRNHDELTLEMVTDSERDYLWRTYAADRRARINLGIRRRLAPLLERDRRRVELMNSLLLSMPGTPVIYYGDEIAMGDNIHLGDRNGVPTPMQWSPVAVWQSARQPRSERRFRRADNGAYPAQEFVLFDEPRCATIPPSDGGKGGIESGRAEFGDLRPGQAGRPGEKPATRKAIPNRVGDLPPDPRRHQMRIPTPETDCARGGEAAQALDPPIGKLWGDGWLVETSIGGVGFGKPPRGSTRWADGMTA